MQQEGVPDGSPAPPCRHLQPAAGRGRGDPAAAQGRGDHDTPATQRQSESDGSRYDPPECRTGGDGWVVCRDADGYWQRDHRDPWFGGGWWDDGEDAWFRGAGRPLLL